MLTNTVIFDTNAKRVLQGIITLQFLVVTGKLCQRHVCLTWSVTPDDLTLVCRVDYLQFPIAIYNPAVKEQAYCQIPFPTSHCSSKVANVSVSQILGENKTVFVWRKKIDITVNGKWLCEHGHNIGKAAVNVTVLAVKGDKRRYKIKNTLTWNICLQWIVIPFLVMLALTFIMVWTLECTTCNQNADTDQDVPKITVCVSKCYDKLSSCIPPEKNKICVCFVKSIVLMMMVFLVCTVHYFGKDEQSLTSDKCGSKTVMALAGIFMGFIVGLFILNHRSIKIDPTQRRPVLLQAATS